MVNLRIHLKSGKIMDCVYRKYRIHIEISKIKDLCCFTCFTWTVKQFHGQLQAEQMQVEQYFRACLFFQHPSLRPLEAVCFGLGVVTPGSSR